MSTAINISFWSANNSVNAFTHPSQVALHPLMASESFQGVLGTLDGCGSKPRAGLGLHGSGIQKSLPWLGLAAFKYIAGSSPGSTTLVSTVTQTGLSALPGTHCGAGLVA